MFSLRIKRRDSFDAENILNLKFALLSDDRGWLASKFSDARLTEYLHWRWWKKCERRDEERGLTVRHGALVFHRTKVKPFSFSTRLISLFSIDSRQTLNQNKLLLCWKVASTLCKVRIVFLGQIQQKGSSY